MPADQTDRPLVGYAVDDRGVATVRLDDPSTRNALGEAMLDQLIDRLVQSRDDPAVRVLVLTSADPRVFSSGGDLRAFADDRSAADKLAGLDRFPRVFELLGGLGKPSICAANGDVLAGAFGLALSCDLLIAREGIRLGCPEIGVGVFPFMISALIYRSVPRAVANELMFTGRLVSAGEAAELRIVNEVAVPVEFDDVVDDWAGRIAARSPVLLRLGKDALHATRDLGLTDALRYLQAQLAIAQDTDDLREGVAAFREKRDPHWTGH